MVKVDLKTSVEKPVKQKVKKQKVEKSKKSKKKPLIIKPPTNKKMNLVDAKIIRPLNYLSETKDTHTLIKPLKEMENGLYEVQDTTRVSTMLKLIIIVNETKDLYYSWANGLWDITQRANHLPEGVNLTFVRAFERQDNESAKRMIKKTKRNAILYSENESSTRSKNAITRHYANLLHMIDQGESAVTFGAEVMVSAPDDATLERAVKVLQDDLKANDALRGLEYHIDINKQLQPFVLVGPNKSSANKDVYLDMHSVDAGIASLFVDAGGERSRGSEYVGVSTGKLITSHAAYPFKHPRTLYVGNGATNKTHTMGGDFNKASQLYLSDVTSRAYLLDGNSVTHFVIDHEASAKELMNFPLFDANKAMIDVSKGMLNIIEMLGRFEDTKNSERINERFSSHINNLIALLNMFRDKDNVSTTDSFASETRKAMINFFVENKYWSYQKAMRGEANRLITPYHEQMKTLGDFGAYIKLQERDSQTPETKAALKELDDIVNNNMLATMPSLNTKTDPAVDRWLNTKYRVLDLTGMRAGGMQHLDNPGLNIMVLSYLNILLPSLENGDVIFFHGFGSLSRVAELVQNMIASSGKIINIVFTESNQNQTLNALNLMQDKLSFAIVDLYKNDVDKLIEPLGMDETWVEARTGTKNSYFVMTRYSVDYIYLDNIM